MSGNSGKTQTRREVPVLRLETAEPVRPLVVRSRKTRRGGLRLVLGYWDWDPGHDPAERHSARLALAA
ncbi:MAG TPA: hypothetical protein PLL20_20290 [Phycisphaerae bacterium]|jgi:hypothetical protein|nr:hypothetical protein [Phycisphaerae bacterium]HRR86623.1 hypothetical protein [Phycisphaerae bacterium]